MHLTSKTFQLKNLTSKKSTFPHPIHLIKNSVRIRPIHIIRVAILLTKKFVPIRLSVFLSPQKKCKKIMPLPAPQQTSLYLPTYN